MYHITIHWCWHYSIPETFSFTREPDNPTVVVEGVNNTNVDLQWEFVLDASERIQNITFERHKPEEVQRTRIAYRLGNNAFTISSAELSNEYRAFLPATLRLLNVDQDEEFLYTLKVSHTSGGFIQNEVVSQVAIVLYGEYQLKHYKIQSLLFVTW